MNGRERVLGAFSPEGASEIPAVICYEGIFVRDHWGELSREPWWERHVPDIERQVTWRREVVEATGQDWFDLPIGHSRAERDLLLVERRGDKVYVVDRSTGDTRLLQPPVVGGWTGRGVASVHPSRPPRTPEEIDRVTGRPEAGDTVLVEGRADLPQQILAQWGNALYPLGYVAAPLWHCYSLWGFEGMMLQLADRPDLVQYAVQRFTEQAVRTVRITAQLGAYGVWLEDCLTDMIGAEHYRSLHLPYLRRLTGEIRAQGMQSIHYYCGNPAGKWDLLLDSGADALALEESKKGFAIDIDDVVERVRGRMVVLGNLDAIGLLEHGSETELRTEVARQIGAGRRNGSRFVMSLGSPVTPGTPASRVRLYCDLVHELGR